jgi:hypothetical protein
MDSAAALSGAVSNKGAYIVCLANSLTKDLKGVTANVMDAANADFDAMVASDISSKSWKLGDRFKLSRNACKKEYTFDDDVQKELDEVEKKIAKLKAESEFIKKQAIAADRVKIREVPPKQKFKVSVV